jgi:hypothetical protein
MGVRESSMYGTIPALKYSHPEEVKARKRDTRLYPAQYQALVPGASGTEDQDRLRTTLYS